LLTLAKRIITLLTVGYVPGRKLGAQSFLMRWASGPENLNGGENTPEERKDQERAYQAIILVLGITRLIVGLLALIVR